MTGGAGLVGSYLVDTSIARDWKITILDNFSTGRFANSSGGHSRRRPSIIGVDVRDRAAVAEALADASVVFHFAALSSYGLTVDRPCQ